MSRRLRGCTTMIGTAIAALALIASITAAAPASVSAPHPARTDSAPAGLALPSAPHPARTDSAPAGLALPSAPPAPGLHVIGVVHVDVSSFAPATKSGTVVGYMWCLAAASQSCIGDTSEPRCCTASAASITDLVLAWIAGGVTGNAAYALVVWAVHRTKSWSFVVKYLYHYKRLHFAPYAGACLGDFAYGRDAILANCNSPTGIYWQTNVSGSAYALWNTRGRGDLIASCNCRGTKLFDARAHDLFRWGWWQLDAS